MFQNEISVNRFLLGYAEGLLKDIPDERLAEQPVPGVNHPAWIIGHLTYTAEMSVWLLGGEKVLPEDWAGKFGPDSTLTTLRADYPSKEELLDLFKTRFETAIRLTGTADPAAMAAPNPRAHLADRLPTVANMISFLFTGHLGMHLGQLSTWRRLIGIGRLF